MLINYILNSSLNYYSLYKKRYKYLYNISIYLLCILEALLSYLEGKLGIFRVFIKKLKKIYYSIWSFVCAILPLIFGASASE
jgi:hypothetical protein